MAGIDDEIKQMMTEITERQARERREINEIRRLPARPGKCPGTGLLTTSSGGYEYIACSVCYATLGPWDWDNSWPLAVEHDRRLD